MVIVFILMSLLSLAYSPLFVIPIMYIYTIVRPHDNNKLTLLIFGGLLAFSIAVVLSGKELVSSSATDFNIYYAYYSGFVRDGLDFSFSGNFRVGYAILMYFMRLLDLSEIQFSIAMNFICIYSSFISVSVFIYKKHYNIKNMCALIFMTCLLMKVGSLALLWRQALACSLLIVMLAFDSRFAKLLLIVLASLFHLSSVIIGPLVLILMNLDKVNLIRINKILPLIGLLAIGIIPVVLSYLGFDSSFFNVEIRSYYIIDVIKTTIFMIVLLSFSWTIKAIYKERIFQLMLFCLIFQFSIFYIPHGFRLIFPISVCLSSFYVAYLLLKLPFNNAIFVYHALFSIGLVRFVSSNYQVQYALYDIAPFYYLFVTAV